MYKINFVSILKKKFKPAMAKGDKKKGKKGKKKKEEKPPKILKSEYLRRIAEKNAVLAQARKKIWGVEEVYFSAEKRYEQLQEDVADILKYLQHEIEENEEEIAEYDAQIIEFRTEMEKNDKYYESIFTKMETEYEEKNRELQHQIQQINAKLFASEEIRQQREEYLRKKAEILRKLSEMEARHEEEIYEAEKSAIIRQDTIQKEMEMRLANLASDFSQATDTAIGETTNKLIRDNISLNNMLTCMQEIIEKARDSYHKAFKQEKAYQYNAELLEDEFCIVMQRYEKRVGKIEMLLKSYEEVNERIAASQKLIKENRRLLRQIAEKECLLKERNQQVEILVKTLTEHEDIADNVRNTFDGVKKAVIKLTTILFEAAKKVKEGIDIQNANRLAGQEDMRIEGDKEEYEDTLKEYKFKKRETAIEDAIEQLSYQFHTDTEMQLALPSSESHLASYQESLISGLSA